MMMKVDYAIINISMYNQVGSREQRTECVATSVMFLSILI